MSSLKKWSTRFLLCLIAITPAVGHALDREDDVVIVPHSRRPFRRQVRRAIGTDRCDESEALLAQDVLHVRG